MKKFLRIIALMLVFLLGAALILSGCDKQTGEDDGREKLVPPEYSEETIEEFIKLGSYKNMTVTVGNESSTLNVVLWRKIVDESEVIKYPEDAIAYYKEISTRGYSNLASDGKMSYEELLGALGLTEEDIVAEAEEYVKSDLVQIAIIKAEGLKLTEDEKTRLFDKYVDKFVSSYGYTEEYVKENLTNEIYDTMQYDKMMEFLMLNNKVVTVTEG